MTPAERESLAGLMDAEAEVSGDFCRAQAEAGVHPDSPMVAMMRMSAATWRDAARMVRAWKGEGADDKPSTSRDNP